MTLEKSVENELLVFSSNTMEIRINTYEVFGLSTELAAPLVTKVFF